MSKLKKYYFEIVTVGFYRGDDSPTSLSKFEFLAKSKEDGEKYRERLIENFNNNLPIDPVPRRSTDLKEL